MTFPSRPSCEEPIATLRLCAACGKVLAEGRQYTCDDACEARLNAAIDEYLNHQREVRMGIHDDRYRYRDENGEVKDPYDANR